LARWEVAGAAARRRCLNLRHRMSRPRIGLVTSCHQARTAAAQARKRWVYSATDLGPTIRIALENAILRRRSNPKLPWPRRRRCDATIAKSLCDHSKCTELTLEQQDFDGCPTPQPVGRLNVGHFQVESRPFVF